MDLDLIFGINKDKPFTWDNVFSQDDPKKKLPGQIPITQPVDNTKINISPGSAAVGNLMRYTNLGLDPLTAQKALEIENKHMADLFHDNAWNMSGGDEFKAIELSKVQNQLVGPSINKVRKQTNDLLISEGYGTLTPEQVEAGKNELYKTGQQFIIDNYKHQAYADIYSKAGVGPNIANRVSDTMTQQVYETCNPLLPEVYQERASIMRQIRDEKAKTVEEGRDPSKITSLHAQLKAKGEVFINEDGKEVKVNDPEVPLTERDKQYYDAINSYYKDFETDNENMGKLSNAFQDAYHYYMGIDKLWKDEVEPLTKAKVEQNLKTLGAYSTYGVGQSADLTDRQRVIDDERGNARAKLTALSMLYLANSSPTEVKKDFGYYAGDYAKQFFGSLLGSKRIDVISQSLGETDKDILRTFDEIIKSNDIEVSDQVKDHLTEKFLDRVGSMAAGLAGILPLLATANGITRAGSLALGMDAYINAATGAWVIGKGATTITKAAATTSRILLEEAKMLPVFGKVGLGASFGASGELLKSTNLIGLPKYARILTKFFQAPINLTIAQNVSALTSAWGDAVINNKDVQKTISEAFGGGWEEVGGQIISNLVCGFGIPVKGEYVKLEQLKKEFEKKGDKGSADYLDIQLKQLKDADKSADKEYYKGIKSGLTPEEAATKANEARQIALKEYEAKAKLMSEERNLVEQLIPDNRVAEVLQESKVSKEAMYHGSEALFNRWDTPEPLQFFYPNKEMAAEHGVNVVQRHVKSVKPLEVGNIDRGLSKKKIIEAQEAGYDAITGYRLRTNPETGKKEKVLVVATFSSRGVIKPVSASAGGPRHSESMRLFADVIRSKKGKLAESLAERGTPMVVLPPQVVDIALETAAKIIEGGAVIVEGIEKAVEAVKKSKWYLDQDPEVRAKIDPWVKKRLQELIDEAQPEARKKFDVEQAIAIKEKVNKDIMPNVEKDVKTVITDISNKVDVSYRTKSPESAVASKTRRRLSEVVNLEDVAGAQIVVKDIKDLKEVIKKLKDQGYKVRIQREVKDISGRKSITAYKRAGDIGIEIQVHTPETLEAQKQADVIRDKFRMVEDKYRAEGLSDDQINVKLQEEAIQYGPVAISPLSERPVRLSKLGDTLERDILIDNKKAGTVNTAHDAGLTTIRNIKLFDETESPDGVAYKGTHQGRNIYKALRDQARARGEELVSEPIGIRTTEDAQRVWHSLVEHGEAVQLGNFYVFSDALNKKQLVQKANMLEFVRNAEGVKSIEIPDEIFDQVRDDLVDLTRKDFIAKYKNSVLAGGPKEGYIALLKTQQLISDLEKSKLGKADILDFLEKTPIFAKDNNLISKYGFNNRISDLIAEEIRKGETDIQGQTGPAAKRVLSGGEDGGAGNRLEAGEKIKVDDIVYHANFINNPDQLKEEFPPVHVNEFYHHETLAFKPKTISGIDVGATSKLEIIGRLTTKKVDVLLVKDPKSTNKDAHITLSTAEGVKPFESNKEIEANRDKIVPITGQTIDVVEGFFNGTGDVTVPFKGGREVVLSSKVISTPHDTYEEASMNEIHSTSKNLWVKQGSGKDNSKRILMIQFTSDLMGGKEKESKASEYYSSIYNKIPGYSRAKDFWEIPQWQAKVSSSFKDADTYVIRDIKEAKEFISKSGYKELAFSVLEVTKDKVKKLAEAFPEVNFNVGGYINMKEFFKDNPNVKSFQSVEEMAKKHNVLYNPGYEYKNFKGTVIVPRLQMSTGCQHKCAFCTVGIDNPFTSIDKTTVNEHVESLSKLKSSLVYLDDKTFGQADSYKYLPEMYEKIKKGNSNFKGFIIQTTASAMKNTLTPEFIRAAGIKYIELGVESYNDDILKSIHKPANTRIIDDAVSTIRQTDAKLIPNVIIGMKQETKESYENTLKFLRDNKDIISHVNIYNLAIYEGTEMANSIEAKIDADRNENVIDKSFHTNPELHKEYLDKFLDVASI